MFYRILQLEQQHILYCLNLKAIKKQPMFQLNLHVDAHKGKQHYQNDRKIVSEVIYWIVSEVIYWRVTLMS